jgi:hypothetical protein
MAQTVTVVPGTSYQTILGWESTAETGLSDNLKSGPAYSNNVLQAYIDMGGNSTRIGLYSGLIENPVDYWAAYVADGRDYRSNPAYAATVSHRWSPINDNGDPNTINPAGFKWSSLDWQIDNYVKPLRAMAEARGEQFHYNLAYGHATPTQQLHIDTPAEYGELILAAWQHINAIYGATYLPSGLEIINEPDNVNAVTPAEVGAMVNAAFSRITGAGFAAPTIQAASTTQCPNGRRYYLDIKSASPLAASRINLISYHRYVDCDSIFRRNLLATAMADRKLTGQNEWIAATYLHWWEDMEEVHNSIWEQFAIGYPTVDNGSQYFTVSGSSAVQTNRAKYLQQAFKYVRYGAVMKGVSNLGSSCKGLPFRNANGTWVVVLKATEALTCTVKNLPPGTYGRRRTEGNGSAAPSSHDIDLGNAVVTNHEDVTFTFTAAGIGAIYDTRYLASSGTPTRERVTGTKSTGAKQ